MKYHISKNDQSSSKHPKRTYILKGRRTVKRTHPEQIRLGDLFATRVLPRGRKQRKKQRILMRLRRSFAKLSKSVGRVVRRVAKKEELALLTGALCGALTVSAVLCAVMGLWLFGRYNRPSTAITVPDYRNQSVDSLLAEKDDAIVLAVEYRYNEGYAPGTVISQSPSPGVTRRLYGKKDALTVTLTVSREKELYPLPDLVGMSRRDACLTLRLAGMKVLLREEYADTVSSGTVLRAEPAQGELLSEGQPVILWVSKGKEELLFPVPDLFLLSESAAREAVEQAGFRVGNITYVASELPLGCVISQSEKAGNTLPSKSSLSFCVSLGQNAELKTVPSLFGMTVEEARNALREVGLTLGDIQAAPHAAPSGTVIAQSVPSGTPITSSLVSVSLTVSQ